jgi:hypothetical protein
MQPHEHLVLLRRVELELDHAQGGPRLRQ